VQTANLVGVAQLHELHGPFDIGEPAAAEFGVGRRIRAARQAVRRPTLALIRRISRTDSVDTPPTG